MAILYRRYSRSPVGRWRSVTSGISPAKKWGTLCPRRTRIIPKESRPSFPFKSLFEIAVELPFSHEVLCRAIAANEVFNRRAYKHPAIDYSFPRYLPRRSTQDDRETNLGPKRAGHESTDFFLRRGRV